MTGVDGSGVCPATREHPGLTGWTPASRCSVRDVVFPVAVAARLACDNEATRSLASLLLLGDAAINRIILHDIADVAHGLAADVALSLQLDLAKPSVRVEAALGRSATKISEPARPGVVSGKGEKHPVEFGDSWIGEIDVDQVPQILGGGLDVVLQPVDSRTATSGRAPSRADLHVPTAPAGLRLVWQPYSW